MAIARVGIDATSIIKTTKPVIAKPVVESIVNDNKEIPLSSLIQYISGATWTVSYYQQVVTKHTELRSQDTGQSPIYQQYTKILQLELKVESGLQTSQNTDTSEMSVTGSSLVRPYIVPNVGDMFIAEVGDGRDAIFNIFEVERKSFSNEAVYLINYNLIDYKDRAIDRYNDLEIKTLRTYHYVSDFVAVNQNPLLTQQEFTNKISLDTSYEYLVTSYLDLFYSTEMNTLLVPEQETLIYDKYVTEYLASILDSRDDQRVQHIVRFNTDNEDYLDQKQFYDILKLRDTSYMPKMNRKMALVETRYFNKNPVLNGIRFTGIKYIVYPNTLADDFKIRGFKPPKSVSSKRLTVLTSDSTRIPVIDPTGFYVLSEAFYNDTDNKSDLEILTKNYLTGKDIYKDKLLDLINEWSTWSEIEQFYFTPILLTLIKAVTRRV